MYKRGLTGFVVGNPWHAPLSDRRAGARLVLGGWVGLPGQFAKPMAARPNPAGAPAVGRGFGDGSGQRETARFAIGSDDATGPPQPRGLDQQTKQSCDSGGGKAYVAASRAPARSSSRSVARRRFCLWFWSGTAVGLGPGPAGRSLTSPSYRASRCGPVPCDAASSGSWRTGTSRQQRRRRRTMTKALPTLTSCRSGKPSGLGRGRSRRRDGPTARPRRWRDRRRRPRRRRGQDRRSSDRRARRRANALAEPVLDRAVGARVRLACVIVRGHRGLLSGAHGVPTRSPPKPPTRASTDVAPTHGHDGGPATSPMLRWVVDACLFSYQRYIGPTMLSAMPPVGSGWCRGRSRTRACRQQSPWWGTRAGVPVVCRWVGGGCRSGPWRLSCKGDCDAATRDRAH
jgi:hypothetical protein